MGTFTTKSYFTYVFNAGTGEYEKKPGAIESDGDATHTETGDSVIANTFELDEDLDADYFPGNPDVQWKGFLTIDGVKYHLFDNLTNGDFYLEAEADLAITTGKFPASFASASLTTADTAFCFAKGTLIATPDGEVPVEALKIGDAITTADGRSTIVKWLGWQVVDMFFADPKMEPVRIRTDAFGKGLPHTDLTVSADHGMMLDGIVVNASALVNGTTIQFVPASDLKRGFTYYHVETEAHDVIIANGAASETFVDIPGRKAFDNYAEYLELYGAERIIREMPLPRVTSRRLLPAAVRARLGLADPLAAEFDLAHSA